MQSEQEILTLIKHHVDHPATAKELLQLLKIPRDARATFKRHLRSLVRSGALIEMRGQRFGLAETANAIVGRVSANPRGFAFVTAEGLEGEAAADIYIGAHNLNQAMHGDRVVVRVESRRGQDREEGKVIRILDRAAERLVGRYELDGNGRGILIPFDRRLLLEMHIPLAESRGAAPGDMVSAKITRWPTATRPALGTILEVIGSLDTPGVDTTVIVRKYNLPDSHGDDAVAQAKAIGAQVREADLAHRTDFRAWPTVTIDGEHARDFDDAISIDRLKNGNFWLAVHIADVAHYVEEGTPLDEEAYERGTSVYFPERAVHMFPSELATGLCSLNPHVDRLVQSCLMEVDQHTGDVVRYELHDGVIHSAERMTYTGVNAILSDGDAATTSRYQALVPMFERMRDLFEILNTRRRRRGSVDFDLPESEIVLDDAGAVEAIVASQRNVAHRLIEEFMLLANETVAAHLEKVGMPALFRVHEEPDPMKVEVFEEFVSTLGYSLGRSGEHVAPSDFQRLVEKIQGKPEEKPIAFLMLRTMQKARYDVANLGHFGLAARAYCHFTSPIRRYPDLVVHRMLRESRRAVGDERRSELAGELPEVARHTSERERRANEAERELVQWKKVRFMADKVGDEFHGFVTGVSAFGLYIELIEHFVEGMVHVSTMADDYYRFVERAHTLSGERSGRVFRLGDRVTVQVIRVDLDCRQVDFGIAEILAAVRTTRGPVRRGGRPSERREQGGRGKRRPGGRPGRRERASGKARGKNGKKR